VLLAINDWGNTISSEANALTQYNSQLAALERQTGTILETHGISFYEEQYASAGPLRPAVNDRCYPQSLRPVKSGERYPAGTQAAEQILDLEEPTPPNVDAPLPELPYEELLRTPAPSREPAPANPPPAESDLLPPPIPDDMSNSSAETAGVARVRSADRRRGVAGAADVVPAGHKDKRVDRKGERVQQAAGVVHIAPASADGRREGIVESREEELLRAAGRAARDAPARASSNQKTILARPK
jgi:hypothetical protein